MTTKSNGTASPGRTSRDAADEQVNCSTGTLGRAALAYAERFGWYVFPLQPRSKVPNGRLVPHGFRNASRDPEQIGRWWRAEPNAGVGLACSMSGLVVLDADLYKPDCEFSELEGRLGQLPETPRQLTPKGGVHYLFRDVGAQYRNPCRGAEAKHEGYIVLAPSVHPEGGVYRWDLGALPSETAVAELPDAWLAHLTERRGSEVLPSSGIDARESYLGAAFEALGWLGDCLPDGRRFVKCPWAHEHTDARGDGRDSSTVLFPRAEGRALGGFRCLHGHCDRRTWRDVLDWLPKTARRAAEQAVRAAGIVRPSIWEEVRP